MSIANIIAYSFALFIAGIIPGPGMTAIVARALGTSFKETFFMGLGIILGDIVYLTAVILGLAIVAQTFSNVFFILKILGAIYLLYIAWRLWTAGLVPQNLKVKSSTSLTLAFLSGLLITLGNPKTMLFYIAIVPTLLNIDFVSLSEYVTLVVVTFFVLLAVVLPYILLATKARELLKNPKSLVILNKIAATILAGTAVLIALKAS